LQASTQKSLTDSMGRHVWMISIVAALGGFLFGYDLSIVSGAIIFLKQQFGLSPFQVGFAVSSASIGCIAGPVMAGLLTDWIGRRKCLMITGLVFAAGTLGTVFPQSIQEFNVYRIIGGVGVGIASVISPMYIAEISPAELRGRLVTVNQLAIVIGSLSSIMVSWSLSFSHNWRAMFATELAPVVLLLLGLTLIPESPRWLVEKDRISQARAVLEKLNPIDRVEPELAEITSSIRAESGRLREILTRDLRRPLIIAFGLCIFQQISGVSPLLFYTPLIFQQAGFHNASDALMQTVIVNVWNLMCTVLALRLVDRLGRRPLLLTGTIGMCLSLAAMGAVAHFHLRGFYVVVIMMACVGFYVTSLAPLTWLIMSEIFPNRLRGVAMAASSVVLWISVFGSNQSFPLMASALERRFGSPAGVFWLYSVICLVAFLFSVRMVPETRGRTLEEIGQSWTRRAVDR
jgi:sugar porter (SP) family MFS transporter